MEPDSWSEVRLIHEAILRLEVEVGGRRYAYQDICARWQGECYTNSVLAFADIFALIRQGMDRESLLGYVSPQQQEQANTTTTTHTTICSNSSCNPLNNNTTSQTDASYNLPYNLLASANLTLWSSEALHTLQALDLLDNSTLEDLQTNLEILAKEVEDFQLMTSNFYLKYQRDIQPRFNSFHLPGYFGGITLRNQSLDNYDTCELFSVFRPPSFIKSSAPCTNPFEIYSAVVDFLAQEDDVTMTGKLVEQLRTNLERTVMQNSTQQILAMLNKLVMDVKDFNARVESALVSLEDKQLIGAEAVLIGALVNSDLYPEVGELWEKQLLHTIDSLRFD